MLRSVGEPNLLMTMTSAYDIVTELTRGAIPMEMLSMSITQLSRELGWRPTDVTESPPTGRSASIRR